MDMQQEKLRSCLNSINENISNKNYNQDDYNNIICEISNYVTDFEKQLLSHYKKQQYSKAIIDDDIGSIKQLFDLILIIYKILPIYALKVNLTFNYPKSLLETSQSFFKSFAEKSDINNYKHLFIENNLPITGFNKRRKIQLKPKYQPKFILVIAGIVLIGCYAGITFFYKNNSSNLYLLCRGLFALGMTLLIIGFLDGLLKIKTKTNKLYIEATGGIALFILLFFFNPAKPPEFKTDSELYNERYEMQNNK